MLLVDSVEQVQLPELVFVLHIGVLQILDGGILGLTGGMPKGRSLVMGWEEGGAVIEHLHVQRGVMLT